MRKLAFGDCKARASCALNVSQQGGMHAPLRQTCQPCSHLCRQTATANRRLVAWGCPWLAGSWWAAGRPSAQQGARAKRQAWRHDSAAFVRASEASHSGNACPSAGVVVKCARARQRLVRCTAAAACLVGELPHVPQPGAKRGGAGAPHRGVAIVPRLPAAVLRRLRTWRPARELQSRAKGCASSEPRSWSVPSGAHAREPSTAPRPAAAQQSSATSEPTHTTTQTSPHLGRRFAHGTTSQVERAFLGGHLQRRGHRAQRLTPRGGVHCVDARHDAQHAWDGPLCGCGGGSRGRRMVTGRRGGSTVTAHCDVAR